MNPLPLDEMPPATGASARALREACRGRGSSRLAGHAGAVRASRAAALGFALVASACSPANHGDPGPTPQSADRQSDAEYDLARDAFFKGMPREALDHALRAVQLDDSNARALYFTSTIYLWFCSTNLGLGAPDCRLPDAEGYARKSLAADAKFRDARNLLGNVLILEKRYPDAIALLEPLTKDPSYSANYLAWGNLGWAQVLDGQVDAGIASLQNAVTQPKFCVGHYRLGMALEKKGAMTQAERSLTDAVSVESADCQNLQDAWEERAVVRLKLGKVEGARSDFERCRDIAADSPIGKTCVKMLGSLGTSATSAKTVGGSTGAMESKPR